MRTPTISPGNDFPRGYGSPPEPEQQDGRLDAAVELKARRYLLLRRNVFANAADEFQALDDLATALRKRYPDG